MPKRLNTLFVLLFLHCFLLAQNPKLIKVKRDQSTFLFFQRDTKSNVIIPHKSDVFYLVISDSLKAILDIETQNAQITPTGNDSIVVIKYMPGINYLHKYVPVDEENPLLPGNTVKRPKSNALYLKTLIDGAGNLEKNKISVVFRNKQSGKPFAEFLYLAN